MKQIIFKTVLGNTPDFVRFFWMSFSLVSHEKKAHLQFLYHIFSLEALVEFRQIVSPINNQRKKAQYQSQNIGTSLENA